MVFTMERIDIISRSGERQKICRIIAVKIRGNILCSGELGGLCCQWNAYHQNLDMIDEMKHSLLIDMLKFIPGEARDLLRIAPRTVIDLPEGRHLFKDFVKVKRWTDQPLAVRS